MRQLLVVGNWKMNGSLASAIELASAIVAGLPEGPAAAAVCVPFVHIPEVARTLQGTRLAWGAQNVADQAAGAYTGEVSAAMLKELGCRYAIVGHSERRTYYGDSDESVANRFAQALAQEISPILCIGETLQEREAGATFNVVGRQLDKVLDRNGIAAFAKAVIAYEPVWAIGTGVTATSEQAQEVHAFIRERLAQHDATIAANLTILYGGSVNAENAQSLFAMPDIDGGLIGGASLKADSFLRIYDAAR